MNNEMQRIVDDALTNYKKLNSAWHRKQVLSQLRANNIADITWSELKIKKVSEKQILAAIIAEMEKFELEQSKKNKVDTSINHFANETKIINHIVNIATSKEIPIAKQASIDFSTYNWSPFNKNSETNENDKNDILVNFQNYMADKNRSNKDKLTSISELTKKINNDAFNAQDKNLLKIYLFVYGSEKTLVKDLITDAKGILSVYELMVKTNKNHIPHHDAVQHNVMREFINKLNSLKDANPNSIWNQNKKDLDEQNTPAPKPEIKRLSMQRMPLKPKSMLIDLATLLEADTIDLDEIQKTLNNTIAPIKIDDLIKLLSKKLNPEQINARLKDLLQLLKDRKTKFTHPNVTIPMMNALKLHLQAAEAEQQLKISLTTQRTIKDLPYLNRAKSPGTDNVLSTDIPSNITLSSILAGKDFQRDVYKKLQTSLVEDNKLLKLIEDTLLDIDATGLYEDGTHGNLKEQYHAIMDGSKKLDFEKMEQLLILIQQNYNLHDKFDYKSPSVTPYQNLNNHLTEWLQKNCQKLARNYTGSLFSCLQEPANSGFAGVNSLHDVAYLLELKSCTIKELPKSQQDLILKQLNSELKDHIQNNTSGFKFKGQPIEITAGEGEAKHGVTIYEAECVHRDNNTHSTTIYTHKSISFHKTPKPELINTQFFKDAAEKFLGLAKGELIKYLSNTLTKDEKVEIILSGTVDLTTFLSQIHGFTDGLNHKDLNKLKFDTRDLKIKDVNLDNITEIQDLLVICCMMKINIPMAGNHNKENNDLINCLLNSKNTIIKQIGFQMLDPYDQEEIKHKPKITNNAVNLIRSLHNDAASIEEIQAIFEKVKINEFVKNINTSHTNEISIIKDENGMINKIGQAHVNYGTSEYRTNFNQKYDS